MTICRIALLQLTSHPAIVVAHHAYLREPFVPDDGQPSLAQLVALGLPLSAVQEECERLYIEWQTLRLARILKELDVLAPDLVLLPECSVPLDALPECLAFHDRTNAVLLAGTHTPLSTLATKRVYHRAKVSDEDLTRATRKNRRASLPLIANKRTRLLPKALPSPWERSTIARESDGVPTLRTYSLPTRGGDVSLLPLICSEALQHHNTTDDFNIAAIISYDARPAQFDDYMRTLARQRAVVAYCNDGRFGGSRITLTLDRRVANWLSDALPSGLPAGDAVLVVDVDMSALAPEVGVVNPRQGMTVVRVSSVSYADLPTAREVSLLAHAPAPQTADDARAQLAALPLATLPELSRKKLQYLLDHASRGSFDASEWAALAPDMVLPDVDSLEMVERRLAALAKSALQDIIVSSNIPSRNASDVVQYLAAVSRLAGTVSATPPARERPASIVVDRDDEVRRVGEFLDLRSAALLEVVGLAESGKTTLVDRALAPLPPGKSRVISVGDDSSEEFIRVSLLRHVNPSAAPADPLREDDLARLVASRVIVVRNAERLLDRGEWKDPKAGNLLQKIANAALEYDGRLIVEARRELPIEPPSAGARHLLRIFGFDRQALRHGVALFDAQLRRVGATPADFDAKKKESLVTRLGGHPGALILAADAVADAGLDALLSGLQSRRGPFERLGRYISKMVPLDDEERTLLRAVTCGYNGLPRRALDAVFSTANHAIRDLLAMAAIDIDGLDVVRVAGVLHEHAAQSPLDQQLQRTIHQQAAAAFSQLYADDASRVWAGVAAEYHAGLAGQGSPVETGLSDALLSQAKRLFDERRYDEAVDPARRAVDRRPSAETLALWARIAANVGNYEGAAEAATSVLQHYKRRDDRLIGDLVQIAHRKRAPEFVVDEFIEIGTKNGIDTPSFNLTLGKVLFWRGDLYGARETLTLACERTERDAWPFFYLGKVYLRDGDLEGAEDILYRGVEFCETARGRHDRAHRAIETQLAVVYLYEGKIDVAEGLINRLAEDYPEDPWVVRARAGLAVARGTVRDAAECLALLNKARPQNTDEWVQHHVMFAMFCEATGDLQRAVEEYEAAARRDPSCVFAVVKAASILKGIAMRESRDGDEGFRLTAARAVKLTQRAMRVSPQSAPVEELLTELADEFPSVIKHS